MAEISATINLKKWWRFRQQDSLCAKFTKHKYCITAHPLSKVWVSGDSHIWKSLIVSRNQAEHNMIWKICGGNSNFWWDNWTGLGPIATYCPNQSHSIKRLVKEFLNNQVWNFQKLRNFVPNWLVQHVAGIKIGADTRDDYIYWNAASDGVFSNKSARESIRNTRDPDPLIKNIWHKSIPFKFSFLGEF